MVLKSAQVSFHISFLSRCEKVSTDMSQVRLLLLSVAVFLLHQCKKGVWGIFVSSQKNAFIIACRKNGSIG